MKFHVDAPRNIDENSREGSPANAEPDAVAAQFLNTKKRYALGINSTAHQLRCGKIPLEINDFSVSQQHLYIPKVNFIPNYLQADTGRFLTGKIVWKLTRRSGNLVAFDTIPMQIRGLLNVFRNHAAPLLN